MVLTRLIKKTETALTLASAEERIKEMQTEAGIVHVYIEPWLDNCAFSVVGLYDHGDALPNENRDQRVVFIPAKEVQHA